MPTPPLKLAAEDADDLKALSALLQDAVLTVGDLAFLPKSRRFAAVLNRYRWEAGTKGGRGERVRAGIAIEGVTAAKASKLRQDAKDVVLELLAVTFEPDVRTAAADDGGDDAPAPSAGAVTLTFSGGAAIKLTVEVLDVRLDDLTQPWPAKGKPSHEDS